MIRIINFPEKTTIPTLHRIRAAFATNRLLDYQKMKNDFESGNIEGYLSGKVLYL
jgi:hypothetical protein